MRTTRRTVAALALAAAAACSIGCSSSSNMPRHAGDIDSIRSNPSPAMHTLAGRKTDAYNRRTVAVDSNLRMFTEDWERAMFFDRPSRLTMYPATR
jgi:hypothetical protein